jgi:hypothetical protein
MSTVQRSAVCSFTYEGIRYTPWHTNMLQKVGTQPHKTLPDDPVTLCRPHMICQGVDAFIDTAEPQRFQLHVG